MKWPDLGIQELLEERIIQVLVILRYIQHPTVAAKFPFYMVNPFVEVKLLIKLCGISWKLLSMLFMKKEVYSQVYNLTCFLAYYNQKQYQTKKS